MLGEHETTMNYRECILDYAEGIEETLVMMEADPEYYVFQKMSGLMGLILTKYVLSIYPDEPPPPGPIYTQCASCLKHCNTVAKQTLKKERKQYMREHGNLKNFEENRSRFQDLKCAYCKMVADDDELSLRVYKDFCEKYPHLMP